MAEDTPIEHESREAFVILDVPDHAAGPVHLDDNDLEDERTFTTARGQIVTIGVTLGRETAENWEKLGD